MCYQSRDATQQDPFVFGAKFRTHTKQCCDVSWPHLGKPDHDSFLGFARGTPLDIHHSAYLPPTHTREVVHPNKRS